MYEDGGGEWAGFKGLTVMVVHLSPTTMPTGSSD